MKQYTIFFKINEYVWHPAKALHNHFLKKLLYPQAISYLSTYVAVILQNELLTELSLIHYTN